MYSNRSYTEEQLQHSGHSKSTLDTSVNLNLKKKGINITFLNIQGICGKEMVKFSEINLMLPSQENKKLHAFAMCETKLKYHKMSGAFKPSSPKGNDRSPEIKQVFLNSSQISIRFFSIGQWQPTLQIHGWTEF